MATRVPTIEQAPERPTAKPQTISSGAPSRAAFGESNYNETAGALAEAGGLILKEVDNENKKNAAAFDSALKMRANEILARNLQRKLGDARGLATDVDKELESTRQELSKQYLFNKAQENYAAELYQRRRERVYGKAIVHQVEQAHAEDLNIKKTTKDNLINDMSTTPLAEDHFFMKDLGRLGLSVNELSDAQGLEDEEPRKRALDQAYSDAVYSRVRQAMNRDIGEAISIHDKYGHLLSTKHANTLGADIARAKVDRNGQIIAIRALEKNGGSHSAALSDVARLEKQGMERNEKESMSAQATYDNSHLEWVANGLSGKTDQSLTYSEVRGKYYVYPAGDEQMSPADAAIMAVNDRNAIEFDSEEDAAYYVQNGLSGKASKDGISYLEAKKAREALQQIALNDKKATEEDRRQAHAVLDQLILDNPNFSPYQIAEAAGIKDRLDPAGLRRIENARLTTISKRQTLSKRAGETRDESTLAQMRLNPEKYINKEDPAAFQEVYQTLETEESRKEAIKIKDRVEKSTTKPKAGKLTKAASDPYRLLKSGLSQSGTIPMISAGSTGGMVPSDPKDDFIYNRTAGELTQAELGAQEMYDTAPEQQASLRQAVARIVSQQKTARKRASGFSSIQQANAAYFGGPPPKVDQEFVDMAESYVVECHESTGDTVNKDWDDEASDYARLVRTASALLAAGKKADAYAIIRTGIGLEIKKAE